MEAYEVQKQFKKKDNSTFYAVRGKFGYDFFDDDATFLCRRLGAVKVTPDGYPCVRISETEIEKTCRWIAYAGRKVAIVENASTVKGGNDWRVTRTIS